MRRVKKTRRWQFANDALSAPKLHSLQGCSAVNGDVDIAMYKTSLFFWVGVPREGHSQRDTRNETESDKSKGTYILRLPPGSVVTFTNLYTCR